MLKYDFVGGDALVPNELCVFGESFCNGSIHIYQWILNIRKCVYWCRQTLSYVQLLLLRFVVTEKAIT